MLLVLGLLTGFIVGRYNREPAIENCSNVILQYSQR